MYKTTRNHTVITWLPLKFDNEESIKKLGKTPMAGGLQLAHPKIDHDCLNIEWMVKYMNEWMKIHTHRHEIQEDWNHWKPNLRKQQLIYFGDSWIWLIGDQTSFYGFLSNIIYSRGTSFYEHLAFILKGQSQNKEEKKDFCIGRKMNYQDIDGDF